MNYISLTLGRDWLKIYIMWSILLNNWLVTGRKLDFIYQYIMWSILPINNDEALTRSLMPKEHTVLKGCPKQPCKVLCHISIDILFVANLFMLVKTKKNSIQQQCTKIKFYVTYPSISLRKKLTYYLLCSLLPEQREAFFLVN